MLHSTPSVSWIVLAFVEVTEQLVCIKTTDRAESCELLEVRLHEVEAVVKLSCVEIFGCASI